MRDERLLQAMADLMPCTLILGLLLTPDDLTRVPVASEQRGVRVHRKRVELLDPYERHPLVHRFAARLEQVVIDLAAAEHEPVDPRLVQRVGFVDDHLETTRCELAQLRSRLRMTQQT